MTTIESGRTVVVVLEDTEFTAILEDGHDAVLDLASQFNPHTRRLLAGFTALVTACEQENVGGAV